MRLSKSAPCICAPHLLLNKGAAGSYIFYQFWKNLSATKHHNFYLEYAFFYLFKLCSLYAHSYIELSISLLATLE